MRWGLRQAGKGCFSLWSDFDKQLVIADNGEKGAVTVQTVFPEHFTGTDASSTSQLLHHILHVIRMRCHSYLRFS